MPQAGQSSIPERKGGTEVEERYYGRWKSVVIANHMRGGRNAGGRAGQYATGWTLHAPPPFFSPPERKLRSLIVQTSKNREKGERGGAREGYNLYIGGEESAKGRSSDVASGPGNQQHRRHRQRRQHIGRAAEEHRLRHRLFFLFLNF